MRFVPVLLLLALTAVPSVAAQSSPGLVQLGTIRDTTGAAIAGATVSAAATGAAPSHSTLTDATGSYRLALAPGRYTVTVTASGFLAQSFVVDGPATGTLTRDVTLAVAGIREDVSVVAEREAFSERAPSVGVLGQRSALEIPYSINVITRELMDAQQASHYGDVLKNDPSATVASLPIGFATLRGFSAGGRAFLYDGQNGHPGLSDGRWQFEGIERIEILKGPSAFLNGPSIVSSLGGVINFVPKMPSDVPVRNVVVNFASRSLFGMAADLGGRLGASRTFGYRVNVGFKDGEQASDRYRWTHRAVTAAADWRATSRLLVSGGVEYAYNHLPSLQPFLTVAAGVAVPEAPDASHNIAQPWDNYSVSASSGRMRADVNLTTNWTASLHVLGGRNHRPRMLQARSGQIRTATGDVFFTAAEEEGLTTSVSGQALVRGRVRTGRLGHDITIGANGITQEVESIFPTIGTFFTNLYRPVDVPAPTPLNVPLGRSQTFDASGLLISDIVTVNSQWSVLAGVRQAKLDVNSFNVTTGLQTSTSSLARWSPTTGLMFRPTTSVLLYTNYAEGVERGGQAPTAAANPGEIMPPLVTRQVEAGAKFERRLVSVTGAYFDLLKPFEYIDPVTRFYVQEGDQRHRGVEVTVTGRVAPDLTVVAGTMYLHPRTERTGNPLTEGKVTLATSRRTANVFVDYRVPRLRGFVANAGVYYNGEQFLNAINTQVISAWTRVDLGGRYETRVGGKPAAVLVAVENVANRSYWVGGSGGLLTLASPRLVKLSLSVDF